MNQFRKMNRRYKRVSVFLGTAVGILLVLLIVLEFVSEIDTNGYIFPIALFVFIALSALLIIFICIGDRKNSTSFNAYLNTLVPEGYTFETGNRSIENLILESGYETKKEVSASAKLEGSLSGIAFAYYYLEFYKTVFDGLIKTNTRNAEIYVFYGVADSALEKYIVSFDLEGQTFPDSYKRCKGNTAYVYAQEEIEDFTLAFPFSSFFISVADGNVYMLIFDRTDDFKFSRMRKQEEFIQSVNKKLAEAENMLYLTKEFI